MREVVQGDKHNLQIATHKSVSTPNIVLICALQFENFLRLCLSPRTTSRTISFSISNSFWYSRIEFDAFFSILAQYPLSFVLVCASLLGQLRGRNCPCLLLWQLGFGVLLWAATSNFSFFPQHPSQTEVHSTMGESIKSSFFFLQSNAVCE